MPTMHVNGIDVNYIDTGEGATGETLVLVHNLVSSIRGFDFNIPVLSKYFRVIAHDQRGHGLSSKPKSGYDSDTTSEDLYQLLSNLNVKSFYLLGVARIGVVVIFTLLR
jgi:pimeloyl-ACP methyl ester carboxylesterase